MVVIAVMVIVSSVVLANNGRFGGVVRLTNLAYDVALTIRQAQVYGIAVVGQGGGFSNGYGVHFDIANPSTYVTFKDFNNNGKYDASVTPDELDKTTAMTGGYSIQKLCTTTMVVGAAEICTSATGGVKTLNIVYLRPEPDARISATGGCTSNCREARIVLLSPRGDIMSVVVDVNGQISVRKGT